MWRRNRRFETPLDFWITPTNESRGGTRDQFESLDKTTLSVLIMDFGMGFQQEDYGMVRYRKVVFQVSKKELGDKSFEIDTINTHFEYKGDEYIVNRILDYSDFKGFELIECVGLREI